MKLPLVNILIANHNYAEWVCSCLQSACNQTYPNLAITIVDANSKDDSWDRIQKFLFLDEKYTVKPIDNGLCLTSTKNCNNIANNVIITAIKLNECDGPSVARNAGIEQTKHFTDVYAILDADDEYYPNKVAVCVEQMLKSPSIGVVYTDYDTLNVVSGEVKREYKEVYSASRLLQECIVHSGALIRKEALEKAKDQFGYYDIHARVAEDYDLWVRISEYYLCWHVPESLYLVRIQPKNSTNTVSKEIWAKCWSRISAKMNARRGQ